MNVSEVVTDLSIKIENYTSIIEDKRYNPEMISKEIESYSNLVDKKYLGPLFNNYYKLDEYYHRKFGKEIKIYLNKSEKANSEELSSIYLRLNKYQETKLELEDKLKDHKSGSREKKLFIKNLNALKNKMERVVNELKQYENSYSRELNDLMLEQQKLLKIKQRLDSLRKKLLSHNYSELKYIFLKRNFLRFLNVVLLFVIAYWFEIFSSKFTQDKIFGYDENGVIFLLIFIFQIFLIDPAIDLFRDGLLWKITRKRIVSLTNILELYPSFITGIQEIEESIASVKERMSD